MLIQTPGSFVWSASLAARLGVEGWSTWGVFLVTGCLQGCLLVMGICFEIKARRERGAEAEGVGLLALLGQRLLTDHRSTASGVLRLTMREVPLLKMG